MSELADRPQPAVLPAQTDLRSAARRYLEASRSPSTIRAYRLDLGVFEAWCGTQALSSLPASADTITLFVSALAEAGTPVSTIRRRLAAISTAHQALGLPTPTGDPLVRTAMAGIRRSLGTAAHQVAPLVTADVRALIAATPAGDAIGVRDHALILVGFAGGFRRSELVALDVNDFEEVAEGLRVLVRRSKTDPEGAGREVGIPRGRHPETCPVRALQSWLELAGIEDGPVFRPVNRHGVVATSRLTDRSVARVIKRAAARAGFDPVRFAGHSLRSGLATAAAAGGAPERAIMAQTGHRGVTTVRRYIRSGSLFHENAASFVGL